MQVVAVFQEDLADLRILAVQRVDVDHVILAIATQGQAGKVGVGRIKTGLADGLNQAQRNVGDRLRASRSEGTREQHALAVVTQHFDVDFHFGVLRRQTHAQLIADLRNGLAGGLDTAHVREEHGAVVQHFAAVGIQLLRGAGRGQFRVFENRHQQGVARADYVFRRLVAQQFRGQRFGRCVRCFLLLGEGGGGDVDQRDLRTVRVFVGDIAVRHVLTGGECAALQHETGKQHDR